MAVEDVRGMADEVASLMGTRFGGVRRGRSADLSVMVRRRGGALPRKLRREAAFLAEADQRVDQPRLGKQIDLARAHSAHRALVSHLNGVGKGARWRERALHLGAALALGLVVIGGVAIWILVERGSL